MPSFEVTVYPIFEDAGSLSTGSLGGICARHESESIADAMALAGKDVEKQLRKEFGFLRKPIAFNATVAITGN